MKYILQALKWYPELIRNEVVPLCMGRAYDRTETLDLGFEQEILTPIPEYKSTDITWTEACANRAVELNEIA